MTNDSLNVARLRDVLQLVDRGDTIKAKFLLEILIAQNDENDSEESKSVSQLYDRD